MTRRTFRLGVAGSALLALLGSASLAGAVGTGRFELHRGKDFQGGDLKGVAIDSAGRVHAGLNLGALPLADAQSVWCALAALGRQPAARHRQRGQVARGARRLGARGCGDQGPGHHLDGRGLEGRRAARHHAQGRGVALVGWKAVDSGQARGVEHVWALAFDKSSQALFAATGPEGKLFRIEQNGKAQVYFDAEEQHLISLAISTQRNGSVVYAGRERQAKLYEVRAPGRASVLYDFNRTEVRSIVVSPKGDVYANRKRHQVGRLLCRPATTTARTGLGPGPQDHR
jgi:hypothetical protein